MSELPAVSAAPAPAVAPGPTNVTSAPSAVQPAPAEELFTDITKLTPELQGRYQQMQADYTTKTQALAAEREALKSAAEKAKLLDELTADARFQAWAQSQATGAPAGGGASPEVGLTPERHAELLTNPQAFEQYLSDLAERKAKAMVLPVSERAEAIVAERTLESFAATHPDMDRHKSAMLPYLERGYTLDDAYRLAKWPVWEREIQEKTLKDAEAKSRQTVSQASSSAVATSRPSRKMTFEEAAEAARTSLSTAA